MYVPDHFEVSDQQEIHTFLQSNAFGQLISLEQGRLSASHLPFLLSEDRQSLSCHLARQNPQWRTLENQQVLVTFQGAHDYISPSWYENPGVPTWNYQAVHVYGKCRVFETPAELARMVETLSAYYESEFETPWQPQYREAMLKAIVGIEIEIEEIQCKYKLSQNRPAADHQPVIDRLDDLGSNALADAMRKTLHKE